MTEPSCQCGMKGLFTQRVWESILKQTSEIRIREPRFHISDHSLEKLTVQINLPVTNDWLTSTAGLVKVLHSGDGRMKGSFKGPPDTCPWRSWLKVA